MTAALLTLCSTALVLRQNSDVCWAGIAGDERVKPSQPLGIISGLREAFIKRCIIERTNKAEIRPEEQSKKAARHRESHREIYGKKYSWRAIKTETDTRTEHKGVGKLGWFNLHQRHKLQHPHHMKVSLWWHTSCQIFWRCAWKSIIA